MRIVHKLSFLLIISCLYFTSCKKSSQKAPTKSELPDTSHATANLNLDVRDVSRVYLTSSAESDLADWEEFRSLQMELDNFENSTLEQVTENSKPILELVNSISDSIPEQFNNAAVQSRVNVLHTKASLLNQYLVYEQSNDSIKQKLSQEIFEAFQNLKLQLNEVYLRDFSDFDFDIDRKQDSIQNSTKQK